jgi:D-arabinan exo alpha-(1,3)/(1,5)-arabinofuranosidase (non-reducing end)
MVGGEVEHRGGVDGIRAVNWSLETSDIRTQMKSMTRDIFGYCLAGLLLGSPVFGQDLGQAEPGVASASSAAVTFEGLLGEMGDPRSLARVPDPAYEIEIVKDGGGAAAGLEGPSGDAGDANGGERTVASFEGPGAVVRIWSGAPAGTLRVYLDGGSEPVIEASASDLLSGGWRVGSPMAESVGGTSVFVLPVPFAKGCRITCDTDAVFGVTARRYGASVRVRTFALSDLDTSRDAIEAASRSLTDGFSSEEVAVYTEGLDLTKGASVPVRPLDPGQELEKFFPARQLYPVTTNLPEGGRAISKVTVKLFKYFPREKRHGPLTDAELEHALRSIDIGFRFDRHAIARAPLGDFMGIGTEITAFEDPMRSVSPDGTMTSRWIMPYEKSGIIELHNISQRLDVWAELTFEVIPWTWDERSLYFMPHWSAGLETEPGERWSNVTVTAARGRLVGQTLAVMNPVSPWWGGVSETLTLGDGRTLEPLDEGDLFSAGAGVDGTFGSPLLSRPRAEGADGDHLGKTIFHRLMLLDAVGFSRGFNASIRAGEGLEGLPDFSSVLYFYATGDQAVPTGYASYFDLIRSLTSPPLPLEIVDPIECEDLAFEVSREDLATHVRRLVPRAGGRWSGGGDLFVEADRVGDAIEFSVPATGEGLAALSLYLSGGDAAGVVSVSVNGMRAVPSLDLSAREPIRHFGPISLGRAAAIDGRFVIRIEAVAMGDNSGIPIQFRPDMTRFAFGIDCVTVTRPRRGVR